MRTFSSFLTVGCLVFGAAALQAGTTTANYSLTCKDCTVSKEGWLSCECQQVDQTTYTKTAIDLNEKVQNCDGNLTWGACMGPTPKK